MQAPGQNLPTKHVRALHVHTRSRSSRAEATTNSLPMASLTMMASLSAVAAAQGADRRAAAPARRGCLTMARAAKVERQEAAQQQEARPAEGRRAVMLAAVAAAVAAIGGAGGASAEEPKKGSPEVKKKYAPICVSMPTARICHN